MRADDSAARSFRERFRNQLWVLDPAGLAEFRSSASSEYDGLVDGLVAHAKHGSSVVEAAQWLQAVLENDWEIALPLEKVVESIDPAFDSS